MSEPRRITSEDLALFAMQLLSKDEAADVAAYVERSAEARRELAEIQGDLAIYAHSVDMHSPPAQARERLLKQVGREKKTVPIDRQPVAPVADPVRSVGTKDQGGDAGRVMSRYLEDEQPKRGFAEKRHQLWHCDD